MAFYDAQNFTTGIPKGPRVIKQHSLATISATALNILNHSNLFITIWLETYQYTVWFMCNVDDSLVTMAMLGN